ncbi:polyketide synthase, partial [Mycobacterium interjectum]|nr:polyketide synthase [Mycobacterium interjectum]
LHTAQHGTTYTSVPTLHRDTDDTITFRTNLYTTHHTHHWTNTKDSSAQALGQFGPRDSGVVEERVVRASRGAAFDDWSHRVVWQPRPLPHTQPNIATSTRGRWLVVGHADVARELARFTEVLADDVEPPISDDARSDVDYVLYALPAPGDPLDVALAYRLFHEVRMLAAAMVAADMPAKLFIVTRNAQPVAEGDRANP